jgi:hypothetical protein
MWREKKKSESTVIVRKGEKQDRQKLLECYETLDVGASFSLLRLRRCRATLAILFRGGAQSRWRER